MGPHNKNRPQQYYDRYSRALKRVAYCGSAHLPRASKQNRYESGPAKARPAELRRRALRRTSAALAASLQGCRLKLFFTQGDIPDDISRIRVYIGMCIHIYICTYTNTNIHVCVPTLYNYVCMCICKLFTYDLYDGCH